MPQNWSWNWKWLNDTNLLLFLDPGLDSLARRQVGPRDKADGRHHDREGEAADAGKRQLTERTAADNNAEKNQLELVLNRLLWSVFPFTKVVVLRKSWTQ
jgi:hypothetical protein